MQTITTAQLTWHSSSRTLCAELSDLRLSSPPDRVRVVNPKTGGHRDFTNPKLNRDSEGDLTSATYTTEGVTLELFND